MKMGLLKKLNFLNKIKENKIKKNFEEALAAEARKDYYEAEEKFRKVIEACPKFEEAYLGLARILKELDKNEEAEKILQEQLNKNPNPKIYCELSQIYVKLKNFKKAIEMSEKAISLDETLFEAYLSLGEALENIAAQRENYGHREEALEAYKKAWKAYLKAEELRHSYFLQEKCNTIGKKVLEMKI